MCERVRASRATLMTRILSAMFSTILSIFSRPNNRVSTPGRFFAAMTQAMISRQREIFSLALRASRRKDEALGRGNPILPRRTQRRECVESISVTAGHEPPRGFLRKKYSHFPRFGERRQGLAMRSGRER